MLLDLVGSSKKAPLAQPTRSWQRSLVKTVTWRLFAMVDTFVISALVTGSVRWAGSIVGVEVLTKMALYFLHERAWGYLRWGVGTGA